MKGGGSMLHNILNSNITGYISVVISLLSLESIEVREIVKNKN